MKKKIRWPALIVSLAVPLGLGGASAALTKNGMRAFQAMAKPPLTPPQWVFPVVWTALYILMGIASYLVYVSDASEPRRERALSLYAIQLLMNFAWSIIFFSMRAFLAAFVWLLVMLFVIVAAAVRFRCIDRRAGSLMLPYAAWVVLAAYLNMGVYVLNR